LSALGLLATGGGVDVTPQAGWSSSGSGGVISSSGRLTASAAGPVDITAVLGTMSATFHVDVVAVRAVPDPVAVATKNDLTVVQPLADQMRFLYSGPNPIQTGVATNTIDDTRVTAVRGFVHNPDGTPLAGVHVTVVGHAEYGETVTRADGGYELAVNGGGAVSLQFAKNGYLTAQRLLASQWQERKVLGDVMLLGYDTQATKIAMSAATPQVARASVVNDSDGSRRATLIFPAATTATLVMPDGTMQPAAALTVRATEFTVGAAGKQAMPAALPATSGYTYCVDLTADEATTIGAASVQFSKPVPFYIENFLGLPAGTVIPVGYYDRTTAAWKSSANGVVLKILSVSGGVAAIDTNGDGVADSAATLAAAGIDAAELGQLASLYPAGQTLWRAAVTHFTPFDANLPLILPGDATTPNQPGAWSIPAPTSGSCSLGSSQPNNSIVECSNQTLGESVAITGTPYSLEYDSSRAARTQYKAVIHLSGATVPASLRSINLAIVIAGRSITQSFTPQPSLDYTFVWDGLDAYGRTVQGMQTAFVTIDYVYPNYYVRPTFAPNAWTRAGDGTILMTARTTGALSQSYQIQLGHYAMQNVGFGGWTLNAQQFYDSSGRTIYEAGGTQRAGDPQQNGQLAVWTAAGNGQCCMPIEGAPATASPLGKVYSLATAPDGGFYMADSFSMIWHVDAHGVITAAAGKSGQSGFTPDGQPALGNLINNWDVAVGPDGTLFIDDAYNGRVRKVVNGLLVTVAGNGTVPTANVDGLPAGEIGINPQGIAVAPDGSLYIADETRILRVGVDGIVTLVADSTTANRIRPLGIAAGPDGSVYFADTTTVIRRIAPDGTMSVIAGSFNSSAPIVQDGQLATSGRLPGHAALTWGLSVAPDGTVILADLSGAKIFAVAPNGILTTVAGTGIDSAPCFSTCSHTPALDGQLGRSADVDYPFDVKVAADGSLLIADYDLNVVRRTASMFPNYHATGTIVPSSDGGTAFWFDGGRHTKTIDTLTGVTDETFGYDANGLLTTITDVDGNVTTIERDGNGDPTAIVAPGGQRTTLAVTAGMMTAITNPAGESYQFQYDPNGLLRQTTDRRGGLHAFTYDADGLLTRDAGPDGGFITLSRSGVGSNYTVTKRTAEGRVESFGLTLPGQTTEQRVHVGTDGLTDTIVLAGASTTYTGADGSAGTAVSVPDPRFGMLAPTSESATLKIGSHTVTTQHALVVSLADPQNPLSLTRLTEALTLNGATWTTAYDAGFRTLTSITPAGRLSASVLDGKGRIASVTRAGITTSFLTYDGFGQLVTIQQGARTVALTYDAARRLASVTDPLRRTTRFAYDGADRMTSQTFPDGRLISLTYDTAGNLTSVTPPGRPPHAFTFTPVDLAASYIPPTVLVGGATLYTYNKDRDLTLITQPNGKTVAFRYDTAGRLSTETIARGQYQATYDQSGLLASITSPDGVSMQYTYDGSLLTGVQWGGSVPQSAINVTYDANLRLNSETIAGDTIGWSYDADGLLTSAGALSLSRDPQTGFLSGTKLGPVSDAWSYDAFGQPSAYAASASGSAVFDEQVTHDDAGHIKHKTETVLGESHGYDYAYDTSGRLQTITKDGTLAASYAFDPNGNRLTLSTPAKTESGTYDSQDRMLSYAGMSYTYTANGELSSKTDATGTTSYVYDEFGDLLRVTLQSGAVITYLIDGQNHRVAKTMNGVTIRRWIYDGELRLTAELDSDGGLVSRFIYATHVNVPDYMERGGLTYRILTDHLGSVCLVVESTTGTVVQRIEYDEFGRVLADSSPGFQPFGFAGGLYDPDTSLVRFGVREYIPETGRWSTTDPTLFAGGTSNLYEYALGDPINYVDPEGLAIRGQFITVGRGDDLFMHAAIRIYDDADPNNDTTYSHGGQAAGAQRTTDFIEAYDPAHDPISAYPLNLTGAELHSPQHNLDRQYPRGIDGQEYSGALNNCAQNASAAIRKIRRRRRPTIIGTTGDALLDLYQDGLIDLRHARTLSRGQ
jgi:RHS repeat-associated protein